MIIKDLVILGRACPEPLKDGRATVCLAGWSEELGFIRLYPTRHDMHFRQWDTIKIEVEENERDTRLESWKIVGSREDWDNLAGKAEKVGRINSPIKRRDLIGNLTDSCINVINDAHRSLGIIKPEILRTYYADNPRHGETFQMGLLGFTELSDVKFKRDFPYEPRMVYHCPDCTAQAKQHDQQILEWGFYEWMRKEPDNIDQVWDNARIGRVDTDIYLLVGNQAAHRTSFMIISVLRVPAGEPAQQMFPLRKLPD